jgi:tetratricopeptide (TPR) repeat protein
MTSRCDDLDLYFDGELPEGERAAFEAHLAGCDRCQRELHALMQLEVATAPEVKARPADNVVPLARRRRALWAAAPVIAAAAAVALWIRSPGPGPGDRPDGPGEIAALTLAPTRGLEPRLSWAPADAHRDYAVMRGDIEGEPIPLAELSRLETAGDLRGLAAAHLLRGELAQAKALLEKIGRSADRESDRAALALAQGDPEAALALADAALEEAPEHRQARWNRALALRELGLPRMAAAEFDALAAAGESGWAAEAAVHAEALRREPAAREAMFATVQAAGQALIEHGTAIPEGAVQAAPSLARLYFYDALRAAPSRDRVLALAPLATTLDAIAGGQVLKDLVERTAAADFAVRGPLAADYAALALSRGGDGAGLAARAETAGQVDIALGALVHAGLAGRELARFGRMAEGTGDAWMRMLAAQQRAAADIDAGRFVAAEAALQAGRALCGPGLGYRCARLELARAELYLLMHRLTEARAPLEAALQRATQDQHWGAESTALQLRGELARLRGAFGLARAITGETLKRLPEGPARCEAERHAFTVLAGLAIVELDRNGAREALQATPGCDRPPSLPHLFVAADLARIDGDPSLAEATLAGLAKLREAGLGPGEAALADHIEGRVRIIKDPAGGQALLRRAIAAARERPRSDPHALKALSFSYAELALDAARRGEHAAALAVLAEEVGATAPQRCALGLVVDHERGYAVALDQDGEPVAALDTAREAPVGEDEQLVPAAAIAALRGCPEVAVFARPPLAGRPGLLPLDVAWSYRVGHEHLRTGSGGQVKSGDRLVVADAQAPGSLGLPRLAPWRDPGEGPPPRLLAGPDATPSRVLQALPGAAEIELHVHGLVDLGVSDASFLALTPDADGRHALTAGELRETKLPARPLVILGACHAGQVAPYLHEAWSLPVALLEAGARAVIASPAPVDDREAGPFFAAVRARIREGASPAVAVRDERVKLGEGARWAASVLVFE